MTALEGENIIPERSFGSCFVGPPGSGKTTCVKTLAEMCKKLKRNCIVINMDPANDHLPYTPNFDVRDMIDVKSAMKEQALGPNGALIYCMESIAASVHEITKELKPLAVPGSYFLIDFPGQVELYTHSECMRDFMRDFQEDLNTTLAVVNVVDIVVASSIDGLFGQSLMSLGTMLRLSTPHINILSKIDLAESLNLPYDPFSFSFDDFNSSIPTKLHQAIVEMLQDFDLVSYTPYSSLDETAVIELIKLIDKAVGCTWML